MFEKTDKIFFCYTLYFFELKFIIKKKIIMFEIFDLNIFYFDSNYYVKIEKQLIPRRFDHPKSCINLIIFYSKSIPII
jgi:hypothetical protein